MVFFLEGVKKRGSWKEVGSLCCLGGIESYRLIGGLYFFLTESRNPINTLCVYIMTPQLLWVYYNADYSLCMYFVQPSLCHRPRNCNLSNLCGRCKSLAPEIVSWFLDSASRNLLRLRRKARCARLSPPADSRAFGARARASRSIFLAPPALVFGSIA